MRGNSVFWLLAHLVLQVTSSSEAIPDCAGGDQVYQVAHTNKQTNKRNKTNKTNKQTKKLNKTRSSWKERGLKTPYGAKTTTSASRAPFWWCMTSSGSRWRRCILTLLPYPTLPYSNLPCPTLPCPALPCPSTLLHQLGP